MPTQKPSLASNDASTTPDLPRTLTLGDRVHVQLARTDALLRNTETGGMFAADTPTPQTVTVTLLRRLEDGDLILVDQA